MHQQAEPIMPEAWSISSKTVAWLERKAISTEVALRRRYSDSLSPAEVDLVFLHYLYGIVVTVIDQPSSVLFLEMLRHLAELSLPAEAVTAALHAVPPASDGPYARMVRLAEQLGRRDGGAAAARAEIAADEPLAPRMFRTAEDGSPERKGAA